MPIPKPSVIEKKDKKGMNKFIERCMGDTVMTHDFPTNSQRYAVCRSTYDRSKQHKKSKGDLSEPDWDTDNDKGAFLVLY